jgi:VIT1/CCC1 family predicted Fe2+/Mn2+ transporter
MTRPPTGFGHYLRDMVYGALDGVITTMAVLAGTEGASLSLRVGLLLGLANLLGDGISMGASNYLGMRSEIEQTGGSVAAEAPWRHGLATVAAFIVVGSVPLLGFVVASVLGVRVFPAAAALAGLALVGAGTVRASFVAKTAVRSAIEMLGVGLLAGGAAYLVGRVGAALIG